MSPTKPTKKKPAAKAGASNNGQAPEEAIYEVALLGSTVLVGETWVPTGGLVVDNRYQRPLTEARATRYAVEWNQALAGLITVSSRADGTYAILDGQHRARAAMIRHMPQVWCEVFFDLTAEQEAYIFRQRNKQRVATTSLDDYRAAVASGDDQATRVKAVLDKLGVTLGNSGKDLRTYSAVASIMTLDTWGVLEETLSLVRAAWPTEPRAREKPVLLGVGMFVWNFQGRVKLDRWLEKMRPAPLLKWIGDCGTLRATLGKREWEHMAHIVCTAYDAGLHSSGLGADNLHAPRKGNTASD